MKTIRYILATILLGLMASCNGGGFTMQSTKTVKSKQYEMESLRSELDVMKSEMKEERDSLRQEAHLRTLELQRYKDSVAYMDLERIACYTNGEHRHSCVNYK